MQKHFSTIAKISLVAVYLVIIAGAIVRMTGSGMGCPDWQNVLGTISLLPIFRNYNGKRKKHLKGGGNYQE